MSASSMTEIGMSRDLTDEVSECMLALLEKKEGRGVLLGVELMLLKLLLLLVLAVEMLKGFPDSNLPIILKR